MDFVIIWFLISITFLIMIFLIFFSFLKGEKEKIDNFDKSMEIFEEHDNALLKDEFSTEECMVLSDSNEIRLLQFIESPLHQRECENG